MDADNRRFDERQRRDEMKHEETMARLQAKEKEIVAQERLLQLQLKLAELQDKQTLKSSLGLKRKVAEDAAFFDVEDDRASKTED